MKRPLNNPTSVQLVFNNVSKADENLYTCLATVDGSEVHKEFQLTIYSKLIIFVHIVRLDRKQTVVMNCPAVIILSRFVGL